MRALSGAGEGAVGAQSVGRRVSVSGRGGQVGPGAQAMVGAVPETRNRGSGVVRLFLWE